MGFLGGCLLKVVSFVSAAILTATWAWRYQRPSAESSWHVARLRATDLKALAIPVASMLPPFLLSGLLPIVAC
jgi:hypothetical protein